MTESAKTTWLDLNTAPLTTDVLPIIDNPDEINYTSQKITIANLLTLFCTNVVVQTKTATGTYTPTAGMKKCLVICVGGGGGGAGGLNTDSSGGGGGGGGTAIKLFTAAEIGASKTVTIGAAGAATTAGGDSNLGGVGTEILKATGGGAGTAGSNSTTIGVQTAGGAGGVGSSGDLNIQGGPGMRAVQLSGSQGRGGAGGSSLLGKGAPQSLTAAAGTAATGYGGGGGGGHAPTSANMAGAAGTIGIMYIIEFLG